MRKPDFCICENKDADQLRGNREADQRLCFCYMVSKRLHTWDKPYSTRNDGLTGAGVTSAIISHEHCQ